MASSGVASPDEGGPAIYAQAMTPPPKASAPTPADLSGAGAPAPDGTPEPFRRALEVLRRTQADPPYRPELAMEDMPAPQRLAPYTAAIAAAVDRDGEEVANGRLIVLYDPKGRESWNGEFRLVAYIQADLEPEFAEDELIGEVAWSWLIEALDQAGYEGASGTITRAISEGFGDKAGEPSATELELRASWSPTGPDIGDGLAAHITAWCEVMCLAAGLPPAGVTALH